MPTIASSVADPAVEVIERWQAEPRTRLVQLAATSLEPLWTIGCARRHSTLPAAVAGMRAPSE